MSWERRWFWHVIAAGACVVIFFGSLALMGSEWDSTLAGVAGPGVPFGERVVAGLQKSLTVRMAVAGTLLCFLSAASQYGFRWMVRIIRDDERETQHVGLNVVLAAHSELIAETLQYEEEERPRPKFNLLRAAQSVLIAGVLWWSWVVWVCLR